MWQNIQQLIDKGDFEQAQHKLQLIHHENDSSLKKDIYNLKINLAKSNFDYIFQKAKDLLKTNGINESQVIYYQIQNIYLEALWKSNYFEKAFEIAKNLDNDFLFQNDAEIKAEYGYLLYNLARIYLYLGNFKKAQLNAEKSLEIRKQIQSKVDLSESYNILGIIRWYEGESDKAIDSYEKSLELRKEVGNIKLIAYSLNNIGEIYRLRGEMKKALSYFDQCYEMSSQANVKDIDGMRVGLAGKGTILMNQGELDLALDNFEEFLSYFSDGLPPYYQMEALFLIIRLKLLMKLDYSMELEKIQNLGNKFDDSTTRFFLKLTEAFIVKENPRVKIKLTAQDLFEDILSKDNVKMEFTILAMESLVELYLIELQISDNNQLLERINQLITDMFDLANKQHYYPLMIKTIILKARLALLNDDIGNSLHILESATILVHEKELYEFLPLIENENTFLNSELTKWQSLVESHASMYQRIKEANLIDYLQDLKNIFEE